MDLSRHVEEVRRQLATAAVTGDDAARELGERLITTLESAIRLAMLDVLAAAAAEITRDLAPGSVEVRLHERDPDFVVTLSPAEQSDDHPDLGGPAQRLTSGVSPMIATPLPSSTDATEHGSSRINLRLPDPLKARIERAADSEGLSINAWLVRAAAAVLERGGAGARERGIAQPGQRYTGWVRSS